MSKLFLTVLNMSLTASYVIPFVIVIRLLLKKAPKLISYVLWSVVAFRLLIPFSFESLLSFMPPGTNTVTIPYDIIYAPSPEIHSGIKRIDASINKILPAPTVEYSVNPLQIYLEVGTVIWLLGVILLVSYTILSIIKLKRQLRGARLTEGNSYECESLKTPFVFGIVKPKIYLPLYLSKEERHYILLHEQTHIRRKDHLIKMIGFFITCIHWFNPLVWLSFRLMSLDMEYACDESVLKSLDQAVKKTYATSLLSLATDRPILSGSPLAFGEGNVKGRIKNVLHYRRPKLWVVAVSIVILMGAGMMLVSNPISKEQDKTASISTSNKQELSSLNSSHTDNIQIENNQQEKYDTATIEFISDMIGFRSTNKFEISDAHTLSYIHLIIQNCQTPSQKTDLVNNHTNTYQIELSNTRGGYSCKLYYDTLYDKAYLVKDGGLYEIDTDFARYMDSFFENTPSSLAIADTKTAELFSEYGWTLDYKISTTEDQLKDINTLSEFNPSRYYYAYHNELSKDIGLDMKNYSNKDISVDIYRIHEPMPEAFYPIQEARGIVVRKNEMIIGAFISAGRHNTFNACSLKGRRFEEVTEQTPSEWFTQIIKADQSEQSLSKLEPQQVIKEYFSALNNQDAKMATYCLSKETLLGNLASNMSNKNLFNKGVGLPLTGTNSEAASNFDNLTSAKVVKVDLLEGNDENRKSFQVTVNLQYKEEWIIESGEQSWICQMVYESPQTGWKIEGFGH